MSYDQEQMAQDFLLALLINQIECSGGYIDVNSISLLNHAQGKQLAVLAFTSETGEPMLRYQVGDFTAPVGQPLN